MNKRQKIVVSITGITLVLLILVGLTYAYFLTRIQGNTNNKSISITTADLALVYSDGNGLISVEKIQPGTTLTSKTFTVENTGNSTTEYGVFLEDLINTFERTQDLELTVTCTSSVTTPSQKTCDGYEGSMLTQNDMLLTNSIDEGEIQTYSLTLEYVEAGVDQSVDMNKSLEAKVQIYDMNNTVDLTGTVSDASSGDYVVVNSIPKKSYLKNNTFKVIGLEPGTHTITVYSSGDTPSYNKQITINKGSSESISSTTAVVVDNTRVVNTTVQNSGLTINSLKKYYKIQEGTFAYQIIENAKNSTVEQKTNLYAEYSPTPKTQPAAEINGVNESTISVTEDDYGNSYYFRGNVANNYVNFAGMCWRIVRIEGDGSVKLLLEDSTYECNNESYTGNWSIVNINTIVFGYDSNYKADFLNNSKGRTKNKRGLAEELESYQNTLLTKIRTKYNDNTLELSDYLKVDEWCYDHNVTETNGSDEYYGAYTRIITNKQPSNICTGTKLSKYSDNTEMYVGTLTADEIALAGATISSSNYTYYLLNNYAQTNYLRWWAFSPGFWDDMNYGEDYAFLVRNDGRLRGEIVESNNYVARPSVTLKSGTALSTSILNQDGTIENPYVIN